MSERDDFKEFFGKSREDVLNGMGDLSYPDSRRIIYNEVNPSNDKEARSMYFDHRYIKHLLLRIDDGFFDWLEKQSLDGYYEKNGLIVAKGCMDNKPKTAKVLDYGAGHCDHGMSLWFRGWKDLTIADIPHDYFRFYKFMCDKRGFNIKFVPIEDEVADLPETYDYSIASEMLEHCWRPMYVLQYLVSKMNKYGLIYISDFFDDCQGQDPSHLKHNNIYQDVPFKFKTYADMGIEPYGYDINQILKIWKKYE